MKLQTRALSTVVILALAASPLGCGSSADGDPKPPQGGSSGGSSGPIDNPGGRSGSAGSSAGAGGSAGGGGSPGAGNSGSAGEGGAGGSEPAPDASAPPETDAGPMAPPAPQPESELPPCKKMVMVGGSGELPGALSAAVAGDCLILADGNYTFPTVTKTATAEAPLVIRAQNRGKAVVTSGNLIIEGSAHVVVEGVNFTSNGQLRFGNCEYCRVTRMKFLPTQQAANDWVVIGGGSKYVRVDHSEFGPKEQLGNTVMFGGTAAGVVQNNRVDHNYFHDIRGGGGNGWETIRLGLSQWGPTKGFNIIEFNLFHRATGDPETISLKSSDNIVRYNTYRATNGEITSRHGNRNLIYGNFMLGDGNASARGFRILGADHRIFNNYFEGIRGTSAIFLRGGGADGTEGNSTAFYRVYRTHIVNNTLVDSGGIVIGSTGLAPVDCVVANNLVVNSGGIQHRQGQGTRFEGNIVNPMGGVSDGTRFVNPMLMKQEGIFRLMPGSPAIDAATGTYDYVKDDVDGHPRTGKLDVGADELADGMITRRPLTPEDVGPNAP